MLKIADEMKKSPIRARDGDIGSIGDYYFDDRTWALRYVVVEIGSWLNRKKVLVSPAALSPLSDGAIPAALTREQVAESPDIQTDLPVSRRHIEEITAYYGWPVMWGGTGFMAGEPSMIPPAAQQLAADREKKEEEIGKGHYDEHLRSADEVRGYHVSAVDGRIGHIRDLVLDDNAWAIRYLIVDTRDWLPGRTVLVSPRWVTDVQWDGRTVAVDLTRELIETSPPYDPDTPIQRQYEQLLHSHYGRTGYWHEREEKKPQ